MNDARRFRMNAAQCLLAAKTCEPPYPGFILAVATSWHALARQDEAIDELVAARPMLWRSRLISTHKHEKALFQRRAIAGDASNVLPGSGAQFHHDETSRQAVYAETRLLLFVRTVFGNGSRSAPPAMGAAKRHGPSVQRDHR
jgi:hypothetical protein